MDNRGTRSNTAKFIAVILLLALGLLGFLIFSSTQGQGKETIEVKTAPKEASVTLNDIKVSHSSRVAPGKYAIKVFYDGFASYQNTIEIKPNDPKLTLAVALTPLSIEAKSIAERQKQVYAEVEALGGQQAEALGETFLKNNPIVADIPYATSYYRIDYAKDDSGGLVVQITANTALGRQVAIEKIRSWGFDPTDYVIKFVGLANPFGAKAGSN